MGQGNEHASRCLAGFFVVSQFGVSLAFGQKNQTDANCDDQSATRRKGENHFWGKFKF
jgi:hypothetical protein